MNRSFAIRKDSLLLFITVTLLLLRDIFNVLLGSFDYSTYTTWSFKRYDGSLTTYFIRIAIIAIFACAYIIHDEKRISKNIRDCYIITGFITLFWTFHSLVTVPEYNLFTLGSTAKTIWICMTGVFIGYNNNLWNKFKRYIPLISLILISISMAYVLYSYITQGTGYSTRGQSPHWYLYSAGLWFFAYYLLCDKEENKSIVLTIILMFMNLVIMGLSISRGWLIVTILLYIYYFFSNTSLDKKTKRSMILTFLVVALIGGYFFKEQLMYSLLAFTSKFQSLTSRTSQFDALFSQVTLIDWLFGKGEYATYYYSYYGNYMYIDNSYLFYMFHFGTAFAAIQFFLPLIQGIRALKYRKVYPEGNIGVVLLLWILACSGFSVYCAGYEVSIRVFFIMMLIGHTSRFVDDVHDGTIENELSFSHPQ